MPGHPTTAEFIHLRDIPGAVVSPRTDWNGRPLAGTYLLEFTPEHRSTNARSDAPAVVLVPGGWDTYKGAFSKELAKRIFAETAAPVVYEVHYRHEGRDGYIEPDEICEDFRHITMSGDRPLFVVLLCGGCLLYLETLLQAGERGLNPPVAGVIMFGATLLSFSQLNLLGKAVIWSLSNPRLSGVAKRVARVGHEYAPSNIQRLNTWWKTTRLKTRIQEVARAQDIGPPFSIPVRSYAFEKDFMSRKGFALLDAAFNIPAAEKKIPGGHNHLRYAPMADDEIIDFYNRVSGLEAKDIA